MILGKVYGSVVSTSKNEKLIGYKFMLVQYIENDELEEKLTNSKNEHIELQKDLQELLDKYHDDGKDPNPIAKTMSWMKTSFKMATEKSDKTAADLMTDGCNMGIKSLAKYLNEYKAADEKSKDIAKKVINLEEKLVRDLREYL